MSYSATGSRKVQGLSRRLRAAGAGLLSLSLSLLAGCSREPPTPPQAVRVRAYAPVTKHELVFDERYLDSVSAGPPFSPRTQREMAIDFQLRRLELANAPLPAELAARDDSVFAKTRGGGPMVGFRNRAAELADIYRCIDSLKVLEHIPLTPH